MPLRVLLSVIALASGAIHIRAEYRGPRWAVYLTKPLTTLLILLVAVVAPAPQSTAYQVVVAIALMFSLFGDVFLMLPQDRFLAGLVSFLLAHLAYLTAFTGDTRGVMPVAIGLPILAIAIGAYAFLAPGLGRRRIPVLAYALVISFMLWTAWGRALRFPEPRTFSAGIGASLFFVSDGLLAFHRFRAHQQWGQAAILSTYYLAQLLLAWSV
ncbi:MAG: lysoplasmalogenase [Anaerolineales bacterium]|nr:lysoplasmalogenase [Anaerolineales bacterium]